MQPAVVLAGVCISVVLLATGSLADQPVLDHVPVLVADDLHVVVAVGTRRVERGRLRLVEAEDDPPE